MRRGLAVAWICASIAGCGTLLGAASDDAPAQADSGARDAVLDVVEDVAVEASDAVDAGVDARLVVFTTAATFAGALTGLAGADDQCQ